MGKTGWLCGWVLSGALCLGAGHGALACAFHGYTPKPTLVDALLGTEQVVLARVSPSNPNRYTPVETLLGPDVTEISLAVGPIARTLLDVEPSGHVLLARDGAYGPWLEIAVLDDRFRSAVRQIMARKDQWLLGNEADRLRYFAGLTNDPDSDIRTLALNELDRVPYDALQDLPRLKVQNLKRDLVSGPKDLMPIRILLAGLSQDRSFVPVLKERLDLAVRTDVPYLGAYATALVELEGPAAVEDIFNRYLASGALATETHEKLLQAMAIQYRTAPRSTRRFISQEVAASVRRNPALREAAARQFGFPSRWNSASGDSSSAPVSDSSARETR